MRGKTCIIVKGKFKTKEIKHIQIVSRGYCLVTFVNGTKYKYKTISIILLKNGKLLENPAKYQIRIHGIIQHGIEAMWHFKGWGQSCWQILWKNGFEQEFWDKDVSLEEALLEGQKADQLFKYFYTLAEANTLAQEKVDRELGGEVEVGKNEVQTQTGSEDEHSLGFLARQYQSVNFTDKSTALSVYLKQSKSKKYNEQAFIFPFGCNASQIQAVQQAFKEQVSVIQGPPGTGKTQTILNIISNILLRGQSAIVVSHNNSATQNIREKLEKSGLGFLVATLGNMENKTQFIDNQVPRSRELENWEKYTPQKDQYLYGIGRKLDQLQEIYIYQEDLAKYRQEYSELQLEQKHFLSRYPNRPRFSLKKSLTSTQVMFWWMLLELWVNKDIEIKPKSWQKLRFWLKWVWNKRKIRKHLNLEADFQLEHGAKYILQLQAMYYQLRLRELEQLIQSLEQQLQNSNHDQLSRELAEQSMCCMQGALYQHYQSLRRERLTYKHTKDLWHYTPEFIEEYPIILSSTYSARRSLNPNYTYDFIIMDEASQVSVETGALSLSCAKRAVIVGDNLQLPNIQKKEEKTLLLDIFTQYDIDDAYNSAKYSFLTSVCQALPQAPQTLLREHYRCHPKIINYCNQHFYSGQLVVMAEENYAEDTMLVVQTVKGQHKIREDKRSYNLREIEVIRQEVLPNLKSVDIGVISPYRGQIEHINQALPQLEAETVHKFQGREKDVVIFSAVDDAINSFSDASELINVAVSRAKKQFILVISGNEQKRQGNLSNLIDYIRYNNFKVIESRIYSVFDYLYRQYSQERSILLSEYRNKPGYISEQLTQILIAEILASYPQFVVLDQLQHFPLSYLFRDLSLLNKEEQAYCSNRQTHFDFLVFNKLSKKAVLAIEVDGYNFHLEGSEQYVRDQMKDHICQLYAFPLLRLSTKGCGEREQIVEALNKAIDYTGVKMAR